MGILNITPDSFSDGGSYLDTDAAVEHALEMAAQGADFIDIGGESTRPGANRVPISVQKQRVLPVIEILRERLADTVRISIDTTHSEVAAAAIDAGATMINDVSAGRDDEMMFALAAEKKVPVVLMHMQGSPDSMQIKPVYEDVVTEISSFLAERCALARAAGIAANNIYIDPGIGFGKTIRHNLEIMANLHRVVDSGHRVMLGASRKSFLRALIDDDDPAELCKATCVTTVMGVVAGVSIFRVHDVRDNRQAADITWRITGTSRHGGERR